MAKENSKHLLEKIPHITNANPYSLHSTVFSKDSLPALYLHFHPEYEFLYLAEGALEIIIHNTSYILQEGDAIFIPPSLLHSAYAISNQGVFYAVVFSEEFLTLSGELSTLSSYINEANRMEYILALTPTTDWHLEILWYLKKLFTHAYDFSSMNTYVKSHLLIIWQYLHKHLITGNQPRKREHPQLKEVLDFIHAHYQEDISLDMLTDIAHMSKEHLCRTFKKCTGYTPFAYLKYYRILQSCRLLQETDKKISEICTLCGFNNISYFNREFLETMNTTPSKYRKELSD